MYLYSRQHYKQTSTDQKSEKPRSVLDNSVIAKIHVLEQSVNDYFLEEVDNKAIADSIYAGYINGLGDKYSAYYTAEELAKVREDSAGVFYGIGATLTIDEATEMTKLVHVLEDTPAEEAGLKDGDIIVAVDEIPTRGKTLSDVVMEVKGKEGTQVHLTIYREGEYDYLEFDITRRAIETKTVAYEMDEENHIATIQIAEFDTITTEQFDEALKNAKKDGMKGLIIDLRDNPGGNLSAVVDIGQELLPEGLIVYTEDKYGKREEYKSSGKHRLEVPLVVLVNENSASAAEILAGAVKDYGIGTILGTTTYGKGIVQKIYGLTDGSAVKLTVSHYYTPKGNDIHGVGIEPDEELELDAEKFVKDGIDNQRERAKEILLKEIH
ncbi:MAG: S41 family peptidase [Lachnospiraceae bacterium]|nr:S41 family peptidase [Lachnospiraceae bacterium]